MKLLAADGFEVLERLGSGSYARVELVRRKSDDVLFAAKSFTSKAGIQSADGEIRALQMLDSPYIVKCHKVYRADDEVTILLGTGMGGSLRRRIAMAKERKEPLSDECRRNVMVQLFAALAETHAKGLIHRDVNPQNVLFYKNDSDRLFLIDYGVADDASEQLKGSVGTASYMAPEILRGQAQHTPAADIYGVGAILFEMKHLRLPAAGEQEPSEPLLNMLLQANPTSRPRARDLMRMPVCAKVIEELNREPIPAITYAMWLARPAEEAFEPVRTAGGEDVVDPLEFMSEKHVLPQPKRPEPEVRAPAAAHMSLDPGTFKPLSFV